jgi:hypothetical protein
MSQDKDIEQNLKWLELLEGRAVQQAVENLDLLKAMELVDEDIDNICISMLEQEKLNVGDDETMQSGTDLEVSRSPEVIAQWYESLSVTESVSKDQSMGDLDPTECKTIDQETEGIKMLKILDRAEDLMVTDNLLVGKEELSKEMVARFDAGRANGHMMGVCVTITGNPRDRTGVKS